jgi:hypothetical protein
MESTLYNQSRANFGDDFADELIGADEAFHNGSRVLTENLNAKLRDSYIPGLVIDGVRQPPTFKDGAFDNLFKGDKGLETLWAMRNMRDVKFLEGHEDIFNSLHGLDSAVKEGLWSKFQDSVLVESSPGSGTMIVDPKRLASFRDKYNAMLNRSGLFSPEELGRMDTAAGLHQTLRSVEAESKALKQALKGKSYPWGSDAAAKDVPSLFKKTFGMDKFEQSEALAGIIRESGSEDLLKDYRRLVVRDMFDGKDGFVKDGLIDPTKMDKYITKNGRLLDLWFGDPSNPQMGKSVVTALQQAQRLVDAVVDNAGPMAPPGADFSLTAANDLLRGYLGTISIKGKAMTAFLKLQRRANDSELVDFMLNPQKFINSEDFLRRYADPAAAGVIMRQADELVDSWYDDDDDLTREYIDDLVEWRKLR